MNFGRILVNYSGLAKRVYLDANIVEERALLAKGQAALVHSFLHFEHALHKGLIR